MCLSDLVHDAVHGVFFPSAPPPPFFIFLNLAYLKWECSDITSSKVLQLL